MGPAHQVLHPEASDLLLGRREEVPAASCPPPCWKESTPRQSWQVRWQEPVPHADVGARAWGTGGSDRSTDRFSPLPAPLPHPQVPSSAHTAAAGLGGQSGWETEAVHAGSGVSLPGRLGLTLPVGAATPPSLLWLNARPRHRCPGAPQADGHTVCGEQ